MIESGTVGCAVKPVSPAFRVEYRPDDAAIIHKKAKCGKIICKTEEDMLQ